MKMKNLQNFIAIALLCLLATSTFAEDDNKGKLPKRGNLDVLAEHHVIARFDGAPYRLCRGRTARCPQRCGDSGEFATFTVLKYVEFKKHGKYGLKQQQYRFQISDFDRKPKGDPKLAKIASGLAIGDKVVLKWEHLYGEIKPGLISPTRPITELRKATAEEAK